MLLLAPSLRTGTTVSPSDSAAPVRCTLHVDVAELWSTRAGATSLTLAADELLLSERVRPHYAHRIAELEADPTLVWWTLPAVVNELLPKYGHVYDATSAGLVKKDAAFAAFTNLGFTTEHFIAMLTLWILHKYLTQGTLNKHNERNYGYGHKKHSNNQKC